MTRKAAQFVLGWGGGASVGYGLWLLAPWLAFVALGCIAVLSAVGMGGANKKADK